MVVSAGKSRKNVQAFVLLPPDARRAIDLLIDTRSQVGVPPSNVYIFARMSADTPMAGHTELQEVAQMCKGLKFPERITSRQLRTYIATVSQVCCIFYCHLYYLTRDPLLQISHGAFHSCDKTHSPVLRILSSISF